jgi:short-subunit dehydrogenase
MGARGSGHLVNVASSTVLHGIESMGVYTSMKHGLRGLNTVLVKEARAVGVKVTLVYPGGMDTEFRAQSRPDYVSAASGAELIVGALLAPSDAVVHELVFRPMIETNY